MLHKQSSAAWLTLKRTSGSQLQQDSKWSRNSGGSSSPAVKAIIISTSGLPSHTGMGWKSHLRRKLPPFLLVMCCLGGAKRNLGFAGGWGLCGAHPCDATDPARERAPSKPLLPWLSMREALSIHPHSHVCVGWRGSEPQQGQGARGKPGKGMTSILPLPYQTHGPAPHGSSRTLEEAESGWDHVPLSLHPPVGLPQWGG